VVSRSAYNQGGTASKLVPAEFIFSRDFFIVCGLWKILFAAIRTLQFNFMKVFERREQDLRLIPMGYTPWAKHLSITIKGDF
jgi:hypothetical protein